MKKENKQYLIQALGMVSTKYGGLERFLYKLSCFLLKKNIYLILIYNTKPESSEFIRDIKSNSGKILILNSRNLTRYTIGFCKILLKYRVIALHAHFNPLLPVLISKILFLKVRFTSLELMITNRDFKIIESANDLSLKRRFYFQLLNWANRNFIAVSDGVKNQYISLFGSKIKIERMYMGVEVNNYDKNASRVKFGFDIDSKIVMCVAFNSPIKGLDLLINAFSGLKAASNTEKLVLCIIGFDASLNINHARQLENLVCPHSLQGEIIWMGINNNVPEILAAGDIYCQPSRSEAMPMAVMEAGMAGLPVVASRVGGLLESVDDGNNGFLFEVGDTSQMAQHLSTLIADKELRAKMGEMSRMHMMKNFNITQQAETMCQWYMDNI